MPTALYLALEIYLTQWSEKQVNGTDRPIITLQLQVLLSQSNKLKDIVRYY